MREDWIECKLEECSLVLDNLRKPINSSERQSRIANKKIEELYPYYGATGQVGYIDDYLTDGEFVLLGEDAAPFLEPTKDVAYLIQGKTWVNNHAHILSSLTNNKFLLHYLNQFNYKEYVSGTTRLKLTQGSLKSIPVKLAPLPEQRAIVKKLESLFSSLDAGVADLKKAQQQLKIYRQAVLKKAFEGELTNIQEKPDVVSFEGEIQIVSGNTPKDLKTAEKIGDLPFYKVSDMNLLGNEIYMSNSNIFLSRTQFHKMKLKTFPKGTIIFPKRGGAILTNKKRILSQDSTFDLNLMGIIPNENFSSKYLYYYFYKMDLAKIADGSAVPQINNKNINPLQIQKYSIDEQKEIVKQIESRLSVCDSIEQNIKESLIKAEALRQSILKKAFEGNLLTAQELAECKLAEDYEPASVLLERIKAEQTEIKAKPSKKKPRHSVAKSQ